MYVCFCAAVTDRQVVDAIDAGADTVDAVGHQTGAGTGCGTCTESIKSMISERCGTCPRLVLSVA